VPGNINIPITPRIQHLTQLDMDNSRLCSHGHYCREAPRYELTKAKNSCFSFVVAGVALLEYGEL